MRYITTILVVINYLFVFSQDLVTVENITYEVGDTIHIDEIRFSMHQPLIGQRSPYFHGPIDSISDILTANPTVKIRIENHTDSRGQVDRNRELSQKRAERIKNVIISNGIDSTRIEAVGYGEDQPIFEERYINQFRKTNREKFERLHQRNRRTLFIVTEN